jgi:hypothetical protein
MLLRQSLAVAAALLFGFSTLAQSSSRYRHALPSSVYRAYGPQYSKKVPSILGGGYSADPHTRELQILADKYRPTGW